MTSQIDQTIMDMKNLERRIENLENNKQDMAKLIYDALTNADKKREQMKMDVRNFELRQNSAENKLNIIAQLLVSKCKEINSLNNTRADVKRINERLYSLENPNISTLTHQPLIFHSIKAVENKIYTNILADLIKLIDIDFSEVRDEIRILLHKYEVLRE